MDYAFNQKRNKAKGKKKNNRRFPYRKGGGKRSDNVSEGKNKK